MLVKWSLREVLQNWRASLFFCLNIALGLTGFITLNAFNSTLQSYLDINAKKILGGDLEVSARRKITDQELATVRNILGPSSKESQVFDFFAMMSFGKTSRLVSVQAVDANYPLYGEIKLESGQTILGSSAKGILSEAGIWLYPELQAQMGLHLGDTVQLGQLQLKVLDFVTQESTQTFRSAAIAPKVFIDRNILERSGLIQFGSTFRQSFLFQLADDSQTEKKYQELLKVIQDPVVRIENPKTSGEDSGRQLKYLTDYLGLVALVAIFLSSLGAAYIYRMFLNQRLKEIAIYRSLGLQSHQAVAVYVLQASILGGLALIPTLVAARLFLPFLSYLMNQMVPFELNPAITLESVIYSFVFSVIVSFLVTLPFILRIHGLKVTKLFSEEKFNENVSLHSPWAFLPAILVMWLLSVSQAHSLKIGSIFFFSILGVLAVFVILGWYLFSLFERNRFSQWFYRYGFKGLSRLRSSSVSAFVAIAFGSLLINILPQLKSSLQNEFYMNPNSGVPALFMFDIQDEQIGPIEEKLKTENIPLISKSPLIRARLVKVNGENYERTLAEGETFITREDEEAARFRNRGLNLSYREKLSEFESIEKGEAITTRFSPTEKRPAKLSIETKFAERIGVKMGDVLTFDVQGVEVEGQVINFRKVKWNSFQPNFFVLVEPGFLDEAPKTFIAAVPKIDSEKKQRLQGDLAQAFPNISILDVERTIREILRVADQMSWSLELMAALALLVGYVVLFSIMRNQISQRRWEINMLKILGASFAETRTYLLVEALTIALLGGILGGAMSVVISFSLTQWIFKTGFSLDLATPLYSLAVILLISLGVALSAAYKVLKEKPLVILRETR